MEIVCDACGAQGAPAEVWESSSGVGLECASCGHINRVSSGADDGPPAEEAADEGAILQPSPARGSASPREPAPGLPPVQCRKCGWRQEGDEACDRCGFVFANDRPGEMPWDGPPAGKEVLQEEAEALWGAVEREPSPARYEAFTTHCSEAGLEDYAARRLRFAVADHPGDAEAVKHLQRMVEQGRARFASVLEVDREVTLSRARRFKRNVTVVVFLVTILLAYLLFYYYPNLLPG